MDLGTDAMLVHNAIARLAHLADEGELADYLALFTDDAIWELTDPTLGVAPDRRVGRADVEVGVTARRSAGVQGPGTATRHVVTTVSVQFEAPDTVTSVAYWMFYTGTTSAPRLNGMGRYDDVFRRTSTGWLLAHRTIRVG